MNVLLSAYACEPGKGSEPGVGWNWVREVARSNDVWVVTRAKNRAAIEKAMAQDPIPGAHFEFVDLPPAFRWWKKGRRGLHLYYLLWQFAAWRVALRLHGEVGFDIVQHVTFVNYWRPSLLALLPVPFVWGPVGGGENMPRSFRASRSLRGRAYEFARDVVRWMGEHDPLVRLAARKAVLGLASTEETRARMLRLGCREARVYPGVALPAEEIRRLGSIPFRVNEPFRVITVGGLLHLKAVDLGLRAFAGLARSVRGAEYWIVGDGPERQALERLARELGVAQAVRFTGNLPRAEALDALAQSDALLFPALHDSGGWASLEAMAAGRPVVCLDLGGPAVQVTPQTGIKVPALNPEQAANGLTEALLLLAKSPELRSRMGAAARQRVREEFSWDLRAGRIVALYEKWLRKRSVAA